MFGKLGVSPWKTSKASGKPSLDEEVLTDLVTDGNNKVSMLARLILRFRKSDKIIAVIDNLRGQKNQIAHPSWGPGMARTFRWACSSPNLMNVPKPVTRRTKTGRNVVVVPGLRDLFVDHNPDGWIVCADADQLELRIMALLAGDKPLLNTFANGEDPHAMNASALFGVDPKSVSGNERTLAKVAVYQMNYGGEPENMWAKLVIDFPALTIQQCQIFHKRWFQVHPAIKAYHNYMIRYARELHHIEAPLSGHRLYFYNKVNLNQVYNYPIQHTAADIINPAMIDVEKCINWDTEAVLAQVHDEIVLGGKDPVRLAHILKKGMTRTVTLNGNTMVFSCSIKLGRNWGEMTEIKANEDLDKMLPKAIEEANRRYDKRQEQYNKLLKRG
jgi:DNA polymerase-1